MKIFMSIIVYIIFCGQFALALTLQDLIQHSRQLIGDTPYYTSTPKLTDERIVDYLNEGQRYACAYGWILTNTTSYNLIGGATEYLLPSDYQEARRVLLDGAVLAETTFQDLDGNYGTWNTVTGEPSNYYINTTTWTRIGFYPAPTVSSTGTIVMDYVAQAQTLSNMTDVPFLSNIELYPLHESLAKFVAYRYYLTVGNRDLADIYAKEFMSDIAQLKAILETKHNYRPGLSAVTGR